jgi:hypothetical protein
MEMKNKNVLTPKNITKIQKLFATENDYREMMQSLRETRNGLFKIYEEQPRYSKAILPKMKALNNLISALLVDNLPHPWLEEGQEAQTFKDGNPLQIN